MKTYHVKYILEYYEIADKGVDVLAHNKVEALEKAIKSLEKEAKREERLAKNKAEKEKIEALATVYEDLKEGELFRITSDLKDKRVYRRDRDGSTQIVDSYGNCCNYKAYPYLTMIVYKV